MANNTDSSETSYIEILEGKHAGKRIALSKKAQKHWSKHFIITNKNDLYVLTVHKETPVSINSEEKLEAVLNDGDIIKLADEKLRFSQGLLISSQNSPLEASSKENKNVLRQFLVIMIVITGTGTALMNNPGIYAKFEALLSSSSQKSVSTTKDNLSPKTVIVQKQSFEKLNRNDRMAVARTNFWTASRLAEESSLHPANLSKAIGLLKDAATLIEKSDKTSELYTDIQSLEKNITKKIDQQLLILKRGAMTSMLTGNKIDLKATLELIIDTQPNTSSPTHQWAVSHLLSIKASK